MGHAAAPTTHSAAGAPPRIRTNGSFVASSVRRSLFVLFVVAVASLGAWPAFVSLRSGQAAADALPSMAPVTADYRYRDKLVAFWEGAVRQNARNDMLSPRVLADQYLQRYRETGDIDDVLRARRMAERSLQAQRVGNVPGDLVMAATLLTLHRFREARSFVRDAERYHPGDPSLTTREASLDMELGEYEQARSLLAKVPHKAQAESEWQTVEARYEELTGHVADARRLIAAPETTIDSNFSAPAQARAWYHFRAGELAFATGDLDAAFADEHVALEIFPRYADALRALARFECADHRWSACLADAAHSAEIVPFPETLGYEADAQRALGEPDAANKTDRLIATIERIGNAQHISDRLLAVYYSEHRMHPGDALRIARRELLVRDDIYTEDTLAWAAAMAGRWDEARAAIAKAVRFDTEDSRLQYHAGEIALHFGQTAEAKRRLQRSLALNAHFHPAYADDARAELARL